MSEAAYRPTRSRGPRDTGALTRNERALIACAVISFVLHLLLLIFLGGRPLGRIDPSLLDQYRDSITVRRVEPAYEMDQPQDDQGATEQGEQETGPDLAAMSREMLLSDPAPLGDPDVTPQDSVDLRDMGDERPRELIDRLLTSDEPINLPESASMNEPARLDLATQYDRGGGNGDGGGPGGSGDAPGTGGGAINTARSLLADASFGVGTEAPAPPMQAPRVSEPRAAIADRRVIEAPIAAPSIDFVDIALNDTTRMVVPEHLDDDFEYTLRKYYRTERTGFLGMGEAERANEPGYFELEIRPKRSLRKLQTMPKDIVYVIDISGSIPQEWVNQITNGVADSLNALNEGDRFNIVFFSENPVLFSADGVVEYSPQTVQQAQRFLRDRRSAGDTDVNRALSRLLVRDVAVERVYDLVMVSDGRPTRGVMDTRELINLITRDNDLAASIYCVGVGNQQNRELLEFLAYRNKGFCVFVDQLGDAANTIRTLASRLRYPIMKDIRFNLSGIPADEVFPRDVPNIHQGESFSIFGRFSREKPFTLQMIGHNGRGLLDFTVTRNIAQAQQGGEAVMQDWAFWKLHDLYNEMIRVGETDEIKRQIDYLRRKYNLRTLY